jgi:hypothetical protein
MGLTSGIVATAAVLLLVTCGPAKDPGADGQGKWIFVNPLFDVEVGEWALYRRATGNTWRIEVLEDPGLAHGVTVRTQTRHWETGEPVGTSEPEVLKRNHLSVGYERAGRIIHRIYEDVIEVAGRRWNALCVEYVSLAQGKISIWYSQEVPTFGILKEVVARPVGPDVVNLELIDWSGRTEEE